MTDKPIGFKAPMIRAILEGKKTQTRRVLSDKWTVNGASFPRWLWAGFDFDRAVRHDSLFDFDSFFEAPWLHPSDGDVRTASPDLLRFYTVRPPYESGDRLWVREAWRTGEAYDDLAPSQMSGEEQIRYEADGEHNNVGRYRHSMFMPRWASRITLIVTAVRVQQLQDISRDDAIAEGCRSPNMAAGADPRDWFASLWDEIHGPGAWQKNPWVAAISFRPIFGNIDNIDNIRNVK